MSEKYENLSEEQIAALRAALGLPPLAKTRVEPATKLQWAPGKDGTGEWVLAVAEDDFADPPSPYPVPRVVAVPDIYASGMDQFSAVNNTTKRSVYESKGLRAVPAPGSVQCPPSEYVRLMDRFNNERILDKKKPVPITPDAIPGPYGNAKPAEKKGASGRA